MLANIAAAANGEAYELFRKASIDLRNLRPGRPLVYDDAAPLEEMAHLLETKEARSSNKPPASPPPR